MAVAMSEVPIPNLASSFDMEKILKPLYATYGENTPSIAFMSDSTPILFYFTKTLTETPAFLFKEEFDFDGDNPLPHKYSYAWNIKFITSRNAENNFIAQQSDIPKRCVQLVIERFTIENSGYYIGKCGSDMKVIPAFYYRMDKRNTVEAKSPGLYEGYFELSKGVKIKNAIFRSAIDENIDGQITPLTLLPDSELYKITFDMKHTLNFVSCNIGVEAFGHEDTIDNLEFINNIPDYPVW